MSCWFEPIENGVQAARRAREGLDRGGDLAYAGYTYQLAVPYLLDCAPSLERCRRRGRVGAGLRAPDRQRADRPDGSTATSGWPRVLRGESSAAAREAVPIDRYADNPLALSLRASSAARSPPPSSVIRSAWRSTARRRCRCSRPPAGFYPPAVARAAARAGPRRAGPRARTAGERGDLLSELDEVTRWLAARAADAPDNFLHLLRLLEAERAWAVGDFRAAVLAFDARAARGRRARSGRGTGR